MRPVEKNYPTGSCFARLLGSFIQIRYQQEEPVVIGSAQPNSVTWSYSLRPTLWLCALAVAMCFGLSGAVRIERSPIRQRKRILRLHKINPNRPLLAQRKKKTLVRR